MQLAHYRKSTLAHVLQFYWRIKHIINTQINASVAKTNPRLFENVNDSGLASFLPVKSDPVGKLG